MPKIKKHSKTHSKKNSKKHSKKNKKYTKGGKRKLNPYFKLMLQAKKNNQKEFNYNGKTYKQKKTKTGMLIYKAK